VHTELTVDGFDWVGLRRLMTTMADGAPLAEIAERVADECLTLFAADSASVSQLEPERGSVRTIYNTGWLHSSEEHHPPDEHYAMRDFPRLTQLVEDAQSWRLPHSAGSSPEVDAELNLLAATGRSVAMAAPIPTGDEVWGELYLTRVYLRPFTELDENLLSLLAAHLGAVGQACRLGQQRVVVTERDPLTGLPTRGAVDQALLAEADDMVVCALDLDGLKLVNDTYGHAAGDRLITETATALTEAMEGLPNAVVARVGGDEFLVVTSQARPEELVQRCGLAMAAVRELLPEAGLSCGIAAASDLHLGAASGRPLVRLADATLYRAKRMRAQMPLRSPSVGAALPAGAMPATAATDVVRLRGPVDAFAQAVNAAGWWISASPPGSTALEVLDRRIVRDRRHEGDSVDEVGQTYPLADLPWTADALRGNSFWAQINDPQTHPTEAVFLAELGYSGNLATGFTDQHGVGWLVEVFCDPLTAPIDRMGDDLHELVRRALS
jgi:diguanylate cyclase (GGDEF)-like protein